MITLQAFAARCAESIRAGQPFIAYRHSEGSGYLKLDDEVTEYTVRYYLRDNTGMVKKATEKTTESGRLAELKRMGAEVIGTKIIHKKPLAATVSGFRASIKKMQRDPHTRWSLCTVEYDGVSYIIDGNGVNDLIREMGL